RSQDQTEGYSNDEDESNDQTGLPGYCSADLFLRVNHRRNQVLTSTQRVNLGTNSLQQPTTSDAQLTSGTVSDYSTRFFRDYSGENWAKINAAGKRSFLRGIDPQRTALVIVDLQEGCIHWGDHLGAYDRKVGEAFSKRVKDVALPNVQRLLAL